MSSLPIFLFIALAVVCCSGNLVRDPKDIMKKRHCTWLGCQSYYRLERRRLPRSIIEEQPDTKIIYSDLPTDRLLEEVKRQYVSINEDAQIVQDDNQDTDNIRHKRGVRIVVIKVCNRRTGQCRVIIVQRRY